METYSCAASLIVKGRTRTVRHGQQPAMECVNRPSRTGHGNRRRPSVRHRCALLAAAISPSYRSFAWRRLRACLWSDARFDRGATSGRDEFRVLFSVRCRLVVEVGAVGFPKSKQPRKKRCSKCRPPGAVDKSANNAAPRAKVLSKSYLESGRGDVVGKESELACRCEKRPWVNCR